MTEHWCSTSSDPPRQTPCVRAESSEGDPQRSNQPLTALESFPYLAHLDFSLLDENRESLLSMFR